MTKFASLTLAAAMFIPAALPAQKLEPDEEGCKDSKLVTRMPKCRITTCGQQEFDSVELTVAYKDDDFVKKTLEGQTEKLEYECVQGLSPLQLIRNMESALRTAGYKFIYNGKHENDGFAVTVQKGAQWIEILAFVNGSDPYYKQTAVLVKSMQQEVAANADAWAAEIEKSGRVAVYGIHFDTGKSTIKPESKAALQEIVNLMNGHADLKLRVEGHTDSVGAKAANQALSQQRAASVVSWLTAQGVARDPLAAQGFGDSKPVGDNATEEGRAKNRRVELVKM